MPQLTRQGGDAPDGIRLDLSSCVNHYGPPPAVITALHNLPVETIKRHPFHAPRELERAYADRHGVAVDELVAVRGASEAIWHLAKLCADKSTALPLPTYTEYLRAFPHSTNIINSGFAHHADQLHEAADVADVILLSNPHNPTGCYIARDAMTEIVKAHPNTLFVFDESYADFVIDEQSPSMIGCDLDNVITIRSPTKFFGLGGVRVGTVWSRNQQLLDGFREQRTTWPISMIEAELVITAFAERDWQAESRTRLTHDADWLQQWLDKQPRVEALEGPLHFRLVTGDIHPLHEAFTKHGIHVRRLDDAHGVGQPALRITAPSESDRSLLNVL